jgi:hypothetical protein
MKAFHFLLGLVMYLAIALAGLAVMAYGQYPVCLDRCMAFFQGAPDWTRMSIGLGIVSYLFLFLLTGIPRRSQKSFVKFANDNGEVSVSTDALQEYVDRLKDEFAAVAWMKTALRVERGALAVGLVLGIRESTRIPELCKLIQARVREILEEHLGTCDLSGISVEVAEIRSRKKTAEPAETA